MSNASFSVAGYALKTEDYPEQRIPSERKTYSTVAFGGKISFPAQLKMSINLKTSWQLECISRVCARFVGGNKTNTCPGRLYVGYTVFSDKSQCVVAVECTRLCVEIQFQKERFDVSINIAADFLFRLEL